MDKLDALEVKKNCPASWNRMQGDENVRHCSHCNHNVYNLTNMTRAEALELIEKTEGRLCTRFYRRKDGTIITKDCGFRKSPGFWIGRTLLSSAGLALFLSIFASTAATAGVTMTPRTQKRSLLSEVNFVNEMLREEKDPEGRKKLLEMREKKYLELFDLYERHRDDPSVFDDRAS